MPDRHDDGVALDLRVTVVEEGGIKALVLIEDPFRLESFKGSDLAVLAQNALRTKAGIHLDSLFFGFDDFFQSGGHLIARLQADQVHFARAHAQRGKRNVDHLLSRDGGDIFVGRLEIFDAFGVLLDDFTRRGAGNIHGDVSTADHDDFLADGELVSEVHIQQKVDALVNAVEINSGNAEIAAAMSADGEEHGIEALASQIGNRKVSSRRMIQLEGNVAGLENLSDLRFHHATRQAVFRNAKIQHSASDGSGFENRDWVTHQGEVMGSRQSHRTAADDRDLEGKFLLPTSFIYVDGTLRLGPVLLGQKSFQRSDRNGAIDFAAAAGGLAGMRADPPANAR